jgi:catechol 2,3-dioxygenase-like lactoylglutathione lyase family enzyme
VLATSELVSFVGATDLDRAKNFYRDTLGLPLVFEEPAQALVFRVGTVTLRVSLTDEVRPARYTVLGWNVLDIEAAMSFLATRGVQFERFAFLHQDAQGRWTAPDGTKVAWFKDPDGNLLSVAQLPVVTPST